VVLGVVVDRATGERTEVMGVARHRFVLDDHLATVGAVADGRIGVEMEFVKGQIQLHNLLLSDEVAGIHGWHAWLLSESVSFYAAFLYDVSATTLVAWTPPFKDHSDR